MKKLVLLILGMALACPAIADDSQFAMQSRYEKAVIRLDKAGIVLDEYMADFKSAIPDELLKKAQCVFVVPSVVKVGFIFGVRTGKGVVSCRTGEGWSNVSFTNITGGSLGLQAGVQVSDLVLVFTNRQAVDILVKGNLQLAGEMSVAIGPLGRDFQAGTEGFKSPVYSYSRAKGLYAGISLAGAVLAPSKKDNREMYGEGITARELLLTYDANPPAPVAEFLGKLEAYSPSY
ncbi:MAG: lipid-binding SYLF domain-containing protein [Bacteriovoracia bacterium]